MQSRTVSRRVAIWLVGSATVLTFGPGAAWADLMADAVDTNKQFLNGAGKWVLNWNNKDTDNWHDADENWFIPPAGTLQKPDMSCWMASASNLLQYELGFNPYIGMLSGTVPSPADKPWGGQGEANGGEVGEDFMTWDDGGYQDWALSSEGAGLLGPILTVNERGIGAAGWAINPVDWCSARLDEDHPVGLLVWDADMYHAITLWGITPTHLYITDSDDTAGGVAFKGLRMIPHGFAGGDWDVNVYGLGVSHVNYAVCIPEPASLVLLMLGALPVLRRRVAQ
ncbi:MAG: hypothetical protein KKB50_00970 [Planctomycetes bacterium]|nr:hypothetical protein [Planctomycetota bacterium]